MTRLPARRCVGSLILFNGSRLCVAWGRTHNKADIGCGYSRVSGFSRQPSPVAQPDYGLAHKDGHPTLLREKRRGVAAPPYGFLGQSPPKCRGCVVDSSPASSTPPSFPSRANHLNSWSRLFCSTARENNSSTSSSPSPPLMSLLPVNTQNIQVLNFAVFSGSAMLTVRLTAARFSHRDRRIVCKEGGTVSFTFIPKQLKSRTYDTTNKLVALIRAPHIGSLLTYDPTSVPPQPPLDIPLANKATLHIKLEPLKPDRVSITLSHTQPVAKSIAVSSSIGEFKALQVMLASCLPSLYGWQVVQDPSIVYGLMDPPLQFVPPRDAQFTPSSEGTAAKRPPTPQGGGTQIPSSDDFFGKQ